MTDHSLLGQQNWVVNRHDGSIELVGHVAGPAGSNVIAVGGVEIDIDVASPRVVCRVLVHDEQALRAPVTRALLVRLLGGHVVQEIIEMVGRAAPSIRVDVGRSHLHDGQLDVRMAALAAALHASLELGRTTEEEAVALQEALVLAAELDLTESMQDLVDSAERAARWLTTIDDVVLRSSDPEAATQVAEVLRAASAHHEPELGSALRQVAALLPLGVEVTVPSAPRASGNARFSFSSDSLPLLAADRVPSLRPVSADEYEVRLPGWARRVDDWWVRAFVGDSTTAVAVVPMLEEGDDAVATMLLPDGPQAEFFFDIVQDVTVRRADRAVAAFRSALATGRRAAADERLGRMGRARELWRASSSLHEEAGDQMRANLARAIADDDLGGSRAIDRRSFEALASDRLGPQND